MKNCVIKLKYLSALTIIIAAILSVNGCGGGGSAKVPATATPGHGRAALELHFNSRAANRAAEATATGTVNIDIAITGYYKLDDSAFPPISAKIQIDSAGGRGAVSMIEVPIGVNHLLTAIATWPNGAKDTIKFILPEVREGETIRGAADSRSTVIANAAISLAALNGVKLSKISQEDIGALAGAVDGLVAAGYDYSEININDVVDYKNNADVVTRIDVSPATATILVGASAQFTATPKNLYGGAVVAPIVWSATGGVGSIDPNGLFTASASGSGQIVAMSGTIEKSAAVTVIIEKRCGNGVVESGETCDDGVNNGKPNFCSLSCGGTTFSTCGNGMIESGETCDDRNAITEKCAYGQTSCAVCNSSCQSAAGATSFCGDGATISINGEICDDGVNNGKPNFCNISCRGTTSATCGNGVIESGETCDDRNAITEKCAYGQLSCAVCNSSCRSAAGATSFCGDGATSAVNGEACDDGANNGKANLCNMSCRGTTSSTCGNGVVESGEACDGGGESAACNRDCTATVCGDGATNAAAGETCDDGNTTNESCVYGHLSCSVCNSTCRIAAGSTSFCGDSITNSANGETCDDGNTMTETCAYGQTSCVVCNPSCLSAAGTTSYCGDGAKNAGNGETCDDGNKITETCAYGQTSCAVCNSSCRSAAGATSYCGDGATNSANGETCDDGNTATETCAYGQTSCAVCNSSCRNAAGATSFCGDYITNAANGETCDDGNTITETCAVGMNSCAVCNSLCQKAAGADITPPMATFATPSNGATNVPIGNKLTATFSEAMTPLTINTTTFVLTTGTTVVSGSATYTGVTAVFTPTNNLLFNTVYTARITTGAKDLAGNSLAASYAWTFSTGAAPDVAAPAVSLTVPANALTGFPIGNKLTGTFSEAMDPLTINNTTFVLKRGTTDVAGAVTYAGLTAVFTPSSNLSFNTLYTATITTGAKDLAGNALAASYTWSFATGFAPDTTAPVVILTVPVDGASGGQPIGSKLSSVFNEAMDPLTITTSTFNLMQGSTVVSGVVTYTGVTAVFTPSSNLSPNLHYTATITTGAMDLAGNTLSSNHIWTFSTASGGDTTAPTVSLTVPADSAAGVCVNKKISATFSEAMDPSTITTLNFAVAGVAGTVVYNAITNISTFAPTNNLAPDTLYTARITTGATDLAGNGLAVDKVWTFTTGSASCATPINLGSAAQFGAVAGVAGMTNIGVLTRISGDIATTAGSTMLTGFHDSAGDIYLETPLIIGTVRGRIYTAPPTPGGSGVGGNSSTYAVATAAVSDALIAYNSMSPAALPSGVDPGAGQLGGLTLAPGVYKAAAGEFFVTASDLTLDGQGDPNAVWVFQTAAGLTVGAPGVPRSIILINGASARNVFWHVGSAARIEGRCNMAGTIIAAEGVTISNVGQLSTTTLDGRVMGLNASVTMANTIINAPSLSHPRILGKKRR